MKVLFYFILFYFICPSVCSQENLINSFLTESLISYLERNKKFQEQGIIEEDYFEKLYITVDNYPPNFFFNKYLNGMPIKYINLGKYFTYKDLPRDYINVISLDKIQLEGNQLILTFMKRQVSSKKKKNLFITLSEMASFIYKYDCNTGDWKLSETKYAGI